MPPIEIARLAVAVALTAALAWASVSDIRERKIPNAAVLAVLAIFLVDVAIERGAGLISSLESGAIALAVGFAMYAFGKVGAGDTKLFAAVALFAGLSHLLAFAFATALSGGLIAVASLLSQPRRALVLLQMKGVGGRQIPYGVAIAIGGLVVVWAPRLGFKLPVGL